MAAVAKLTIWAGDFGRINCRFGSYRADNGDLIFTFLLRRNVRVWLTEEVEAPSWRATRRRDFARTQITAHLQ